MTEAVDVESVPLICDPVPGARLMPGILIADRQLSAQEIARLKAEWTLQTVGGSHAAYIVPPGFSWVSIWDEPQWPGAEFCAA